MLTRKVSSITYGKKQQYSLEKCRICLDDGQISIFGNNDISRDVSEFGDIEIRKDDKLPQYLCEACYTLLEAAILFRKTAKQTDEILRKPDILESDSEDSDNINDSEPYVQTEYLEFNNTSDSEFDSFDCDVIKSENKSEDESLNASEVVMQENNGNKDYQIKLLNIKEGDQEEINYNADSETIMIIVSDKGKQKQMQPGCEKCNIPFETLDELLIHNSKTHPEPAPDEKECDICHNFVKKNAYNDHLKEHRQKYKEKYNKKYAKVNCRICDKKVGKAYLKYHMKMHGTLEEQAERLIQCPICNNKYSTYYFKDHMKRIHDKDIKKIHVLSKEKSKEESPKTEKFNKCPVCDKNILESEYKMHLAKHGGPLRRYICDKCGKVFKHLSAFKTHCLTHGSELKYKCQFCPYRGLHQGLLRVHVRTHTGDYNYKCTECPARFLTKSNLTKHIQRHKCLYKHKCDICQKGFYTKRDVEKHTKNSHMDARNNICDICGKGFGHRDNMLNHQLKVHKRDKISIRGRIPAYLKAEQNIDSE